MFAEPLVPWPPKKETITIRVDSDVLGWFNRQGTRLSDANRAATRTTR
jgi:uncharacterized protein (DUF4415 family)